jgi:hypothetical protein
MRCSDGYQYGQNYSVAVTYKGKTVYATVGESGPWNVDDNYWSTIYDPQPRQLTSMAITAVWISMVGL